eukprot:2349-Eustigmatos_ZCMA.PRE.1
MVAVSISITFAHRCSLRPSVEFIVIRRKAPSGSTDHMQREPSGLILAFSACKRLTGRVDQRKLLWVPA